MLGEFSQLSFFFVTVVPPLLPGTLLLTIVAGSPATIERPFKKCHCADMGQFLHSIILSSTAAKISECLARTLGCWPFSLGLAKTPCVGCVRMPPKRSPERILPSHSPEHKTGLNPIGRRGRTLVCAKLAEQFCISISQMLCYWAGGAAVGLFMS